MCALGGECEREVVLVAEFSHKLLSDSHVALEVGLGVDAMPIGSTVVHVTIVPHVPRTRIVLGWRALPAGQLLERIMKDAHGGEHRIVVPQSAHAFL